MNDINSLRSLHPPGEGLSSNAILSLCDEVESLRLRLTQTEALVSAAVKWGASSGWIKKAEAYIAEHS